MIKSTRITILFAILLTISLSNIYAQTSIEVTPEQGLRSAIEFAATSKIDTIKLSVSGGVYAEVDTFAYQISKPVVIMAKPGLAEKPILVNATDPTQKEILEIFRVSDNLTLIGVVLDGGYATSRGMKYAIRVGPDMLTDVPAKKGLNLIVKNCDFKNFYADRTGDGHAVYFLKDVEAGKVLIEDCDINGTGYEAIRMTETEKYTTERCLDTLIVRNVTFQNVDAECFRFYGDKDETTADAYVLFEHLTINKCNTRTSYIKNNSNTILRDVIITNDYNGSHSRNDYLLEVQAKGSMISHIDTFNITPDMRIRASKGSNIFGSETGTIDTATVYAFDPKYTDAANGNFTLMAGSPAYGKGHDGTALGDLKWATAGPTSVEESFESAVPNDYAISQNYPNPFNPTTNIKFSIPEAGFVKVVVYDLLGQVVETLVDGFKNSGSYTLNFNAGNITSGIYLYQITTNNFVQTKKMILLK